MTYTPEEFVIAYEAGARDFSSTIFVGDFSNKVFDQINLAQADLSGSILNFTQFIHCDLRQTKFSPFILNTKFDLCLVEKHLINMQTNPSFFWSYDLLLEDIKPLLNLPITLDRWRKAFHWLTSDQLNQLEKKLAIRARKEEKQPAWRSLWQIRQQCNDMITNIQNVINTRLAINEIVLNEKKQSLN